MNKTQKGRRTVWAVSEITKTAQIQGLFDTRQLAEQFLLTPRWNHKFFETRVQRYTCHTYVTCHERDEQDYTKGKDAPLKQFVVQKQSINYNK